mmetsp:Transcript_13726/g.25759  ORF Transcript_13726/g.25759 Transcript_13726/m.25759 type:complete len:264 (-) Transcript_13726:681-1472(-)
MVASLSPISDFKSATADSCSFRRLSRLSAVSPCFNCSADRAEACSVLSCVTVASCASREEVASVRRASLAFPDSSSRRRRLLLPSSAFRSCALSSSAPFLDLAVSRSRSALSVSASSLSFPISASPSCWAFCSFAMIASSPSDVSLFCSSSSRHRSNASRRAASLSSSSVRTAASVCISSPRLLILSLICLCSSSSSLCDTRSVTVSCSFSSCSAHLFTRLVTSFSRMFRYRFTFFFSASSDLTDSFSPFRSSSSRPSPAVIF